jgi:hypothetical protein
MCLIIILMKKEIFAGLMPVILATQEAETGWILSQGPPRQKSLQDPISTNNWVQ